MSLPRWIFWMLAGLVLSSAWITLARLVFHLGDWHTAWWAGGISGATVLLAVRRS